MQKSNLLSLDEAIKKIKLSFDKISSEDVFIQNALGRCLSKPVVSNIDNPKYDVSSMDGYAVNYNNYTKINKETPKKHLRELSHYLLKHKNHFSQFLLSQFQIYDCIFY